MPINVPKLALYGTGFIVGVACLGVLVTVKVACDIARDLGLR